MGRGEGGKLNALNAIETRISGSKSEEYQEKIMLYMKASRKTTKHGLMPAI